MALFTKRVLLSLFAGILVGEFIINTFSVVDTLQALVDLAVQLLTTPWILKTFGFIFLMGAVMHLMERSGGVNGFVYMLTHKLAVIKSDRAALLLVYAIGIVIFIESTITVLVAGSIGRPLCDARGISRAKLAYVADSTSAPVSSVLMFNGWGALMLGLITTQIGQGVMGGESVAWLMEAVILNFYALAALTVTFLVIWFKIDLGAMKTAVVKNEVGEIQENGHPMYMIVPIVMMVGGVFLFLFITGGGDILKGSGSSSIFYTMLVTLAVMGLFFVLKGIMPLKTVIKESVGGIRGMQAMVLILLFAFAIGQVTSDMHTGMYLASYVNAVLSPMWLAAAVFLLAAVMSFSTGTSWGTFSIMVPIAIPLAAAMDADMALVLGAVISGGVFGDHCSPISDTTIISSMASGCDHVEHVKTQLPYALISGTIAFLLFALFGMMR
ncbi:Na+/H+ antiporter NhaC family protein [Sulfurimonas sp. HSL3-7]|uniref:Na+/H+ antiporter NhaC family protein n=1 Tax=Sulfonitrofixus jiaomeiensis TaxID=3131938 RepID=UPI0031F8C9A5